MAKQKRTNLVGFHINVNRKIRNDYRDMCFKAGIPMTVPVELFMKEFAEGKIVFRLGKDNAELEIDE